MSNGPKNYSQAEIALRAAGITIAKHFFGGLFPTKDPVISEIDNKGDESQQVLSMDTADTQSIKTKKRGGILGWLGDLFKSEPLKCPSCGSEDYSEEIEYEPRSTYETRQTSTMSAYPQTFVSINEVGTKIVRQFCGKCNYKKILRDSYTRVIQSYYTKVG